MPTTLNPILDAYRAGHQTLLVSGRSLSDLHVNERGEIRPLRHTLVRRAREEFGMGCVIFNLAQGGRWEWQGGTAEVRNQFEKTMNQADIPLGAGIQATTDPRLPPYERAFLLLSALHRSLESTSAIPPILALWEFSEDLVPNNNHGNPSDWMIQISELLLLMASDYQRRHHPFLMVLNGVPEHIDQRVARAFRLVHLCQPDGEAKLVFIRALRTAANTTAATFEEGLDDQVVANLTSRTPNQSLEEAFLGSARTGKPLTHIQLIENKRDDVVTLSEGTLSVLNTDRVRNIRLVGRTIELPLRLLRLWGQGLKEGNPLTPMNVILAGAPSTAKTDLALLIALESGNPTYAMLSPKGSLVGEAERRSRLLFRVFKELSPAFGMIDEITDAFPTERNEMNLDSGATAAVTAEMLNALSDSSRAGRTLLIATTNCPWRVGAAMASRFLYVPVLMAVKEDYPEILCAVAASLLPQIDWDAANGEILDAAMLFHQKGASPRIMRSLISSKISTWQGNAGPALLKRAATACSPQDPRDRASAEYADLFAIRACSDLEMFPWYGRISNYPLPNYLKGIVDEGSGDIDMELLNRRINELKPHVNV